MEREGAETMTCRECGNRMKVRKSTPVSGEEETREYRCPNCHRRIETAEKVVRRLAPVVMQR